MIAGGNIAIDASRQSFWQLVIWVLAGAASCATSKDSQKENIDEYREAQRPPEWVMSPGPDQFVGHSYCYTQGPEGQHLAIAEAQMDGIEQVFGQKCLMSRNRDRTGIRVKPRDCYKESCQTDAGRRGIRYYLLYDLNDASFSCP